MPPKRIGNLHPNIVPYQPFRASDGELILACGNDNLFNKFCEVGGCQELTKDERFATNAKRVENREAITALLEPVFRKRSTREWVDALEAAGVPSGPINNIKQVFEEPQVVARGDGASTSPRASLPPEPTTKCVIPCCGFVRS